MYQLNDDCLLHIFKLLNIKDQLSLAQVSEQFRYLIVSGIWSRRFRNISTHETCFQSLSIMEYKNFFQLNAENIRILHIEDTKHFAFTSYLNRYTNRPDFSFYFSLRMANLKELYCHDQRLHDGYIEMLSKYCPLLEIFHTESTHITGAYMDHLPMLREARMGDRIIKFERSYSQVPQIQPAVCILTN
ncbi:uncharacterized protein LOC106091676 [Stomoxys calcitrans]|uniref:uncharacterized protein LOC106091676 n=1 Tax=Stomoxys calcitrans TaxID=35570 RepID=UPI0027E2E549|nr:uncharacterized protein LOC106091676 [Stomoxys calcitrans]